MDGENKPHHKKTASFSKKNRKSQPHTQKRRKKEKLRKSPTNEIKLPKKIKKIPIKRAETALLGNRGSRESEL